MFGLFKKKEKEPEAQGDSGRPKHPAAAALSAQFAPEEFDILAVTGANGFGGERAPEEEYWTVTLPLTAWKEEGSPIHQENTVLVALADDKVLPYLRRLAPRDAIIQARVRQGLENDRFLLVGMPSPVMDQELKVILDEQKKPVTFWESGLGTFTLNRSVGWFELEADWLDQPVRLEFDQDENRADCLLHLHTLMDHQQEWDHRIRSFAADKLLELANQWAQEEGEEESPQEVTQEDFMSRMELDAVQVYEDGAFDFWFNDGDLFWGHSIHVTGSLESGPEDAQMEG